MYIGRDAEKTERHGMTRATTKIDNDGGRREKKVAKHHIALYTKGSYILVRWLRNVNMHIQNANKVNWYGHTSTRLLFHSSHTLLSFCSFAHLLSKYRFVVVVHRSNRAFVLYVYKVHTHTRIETTIHMCVLTHTHVGPFDRSFICSFVRSFVSWLVVSWFLSRSKWHIHTLT